MRYIARPLGIDQIPGWPGNFGRYSSLTKLRSFGVSGENVVLDRFANIFGPFCALPQSKVETGSGRLACRVRSFGEDTI